MKKLKFWLLACAAIVMLPDAKSQSAGLDWTPKLIPEPLKVQKDTTRGKEYFAFYSLNPIYDRGNKELKQIVDLLGEEVFISARMEKTFDFRVELIDDDMLGDEGYRLKVDREGIRIEARKPAGIFYGTKTLLQCFMVKESPENLKKYKQRKEGEKGREPHYLLESIQIEDSPRFAWRGLMLDVSRHWFTKDEVKRYIDEMAKYKFNIFHWHLTDDQGWRIKINSLPRLTQVGAWRAPRVGDWWSREPQRDGEAPTYGGYYSKEDIAEVIEYARRRFITVVPEVDVPGHSLAAIVAYPELACFPDEAPKAVNVGNKFYTIDQNTLCVGSPKTMEYMEKIFSEVVKMFPSEYIHIGGDEAWKGFWKRCPKCQALMEREGLKDVNELQSYFIRQMQQLLAAKGKKIIGWDEIHEGGLAPDATVMSWRGMQGGIDAARQGHHVIMTPNDHCYIDLYQGEPTVEPNTYSMNRLTNSYNWDPVPEGIDPEWILGGQGNLWAESVPTFRHAEYMTWPRGWALAEVFWSDPAKKDWTKFVKKVERYMSEADFRDVGYARSMYNAIVTTEVDSSDNLWISLATEIPGLEIRYTFDNTIPDGHNGMKYEGKPLQVPLNASRITIMTYRTYRLLWHDRSKPESGYWPGWEAGDLIRLDMDQLRKRAVKRQRQVGNLTD